MEENWNGLKCKTKGTTTKENEKEEVTTYFATFERVDADGGFVTVTVRSSNELKAAQGEISSFTKTNPQTQLPTE